MAITDIAKADSVNDLWQDKPATPNVPSFFDDSSEIQCPHCGTVQWSLDESETGLYQDDEPIVRKCDYTDCGKTFKIEVHISYSYWTEVDADV